jgi:hypothetical protein
VGAFRVSRREGEQVELFLFEDQGEATGEVGKAADDDHQERAEGQGAAEEDVEDSLPPRDPKRSHLVNMKLYGQSYLFIGTMETVTAMSMFFYYMWSYAGIPINKMFFAFGPKYPSE